MELQTVGTKYQGFIYRRQPRNVYWETTISCDLACQHCRASAIPHRDPAELTTEQGKALMRSVQELGSMLVLTGGDPLKRPDIAELIEYGRSLPIHVSITPSTTPLLQRETVERFRDLGVTAMGVSLDGPTAEMHDAFRNVPGTFDYSMRALRGRVSSTFQCRSTRRSRQKRFRTSKRCTSCSATTAAPPVRRWSLFLLIPVGRGAELHTPSADDVEKLFAWVYSISSEAPFRVGTTEAPHYRRYWIQQKLAEGMPLEAIQARARQMSFGIRDGNGVIFVSHLGEVYPAGFLPYPLLGQRQRAAAS